MFGVMNSDNDLVPADAVRKITVKSVAVNDGARKDRHCFSVYIELDDRDDFIYRPLHRRRCWSVVRAEPLLVTMDVVSYQIRNSILTVRCNWSTTVPDDNYVFGASAGRLESPVIQDISHKARPATCDVRSDRLSDQAIDMPLTTARCVLFA